MSLLFGIITTGSMLGVLATSFYFQTNLSDDHKKIEKIAQNVGLFVKEDKAKKFIRLHRKTFDKETNSTQYVYQIPLGLEFNDFLDKKGKFVDGLNNRSFRHINLMDFKKINFDKPIIKQIQNIIQNRITLNKEIEMEYDGMLKITVYNQGLKSHLDYDEKLLSKLHGWEVPVGETFKELIKHDFEKRQMLVVAGMTTYGKTVFLKNVITTLITKKPDDVVFTLIDLKGGLAFNRFANCKQVKNFATDMKETIDSLEEIHSEMEVRMKEFKEKGFENISEASYKQRHFIIVDEGAEIAGFEDKETRERCTYLIGEIARIGANLGYRIVFATQYPTADVFPRQVKANTSGALCFKLKNSTQSIVVLDRGGAEELPVDLKGRAIYQTDRDLILQTPFIDNKFIDKQIKVHFRPRSEKLEQSTKENGEGRKYTTIFEEVGLLDEKPNSNTPRSKK